MTIFTMLYQPDSSYDAFKISTDTTKKTLQLQESSLYPFLK